MDSIKEAYDIIYEKLDEWMTSIVEHIPNLVLAIIVFIAFIVMSKITKRGIRKWLGKMEYSPSLINLIGSLTSLVIASIGLFVSLEILDLSKAVTSLLAGIGVVGLALGFAFQEIASNLISGVILAFNSPVNEGDLIEAHGFFGTVEHIGLRSMTIISPQGQNIQVPNRMIFQNPFINYTLTKRRRIDLKCGISYGDNLQKVQDLVLDTVKQVDGVIKEGADQPYFCYEGFGDSSINFMVQVWMDVTRQRDFLTIRSECIKAIKSAFDQNDIMIPFPIRTLDFGIKGGEKLDSMLKKS